jgi:3-keto-5-aminohexanoate cleavage enzyme
MRELARAMKQHGVKPEFEVYEEGHIHNAMARPGKGWSNPPYNFQFVLGVPGAMAPRPQEPAFPSGGPAGKRHWGVAGVGRHQLILGRHRHCRGGNARSDLRTTYTTAKGVPRKATPNRSPGSSVWPGAGAGNRLA